MKRPLLVVSLLVMAGTGLLMGVGPDSAEHTFALAPFYIGDHAIIQIGGNQEEFKIASRTRSIDGHGVEVSAVRVDWTDRHGAFLLELDADTGQILRLATADADPLFHHSFIGSARNSMASLYGFLGLQGRTISPDPQSMALMGDEVTVWASDEGKEIRVDVVNEFHVLGDDGQWLPDSWHRVWWYGDGPFPVATASKKDDGTFSERRNLLISHTRGSGERLEPFDAFPKIEFCNGCTRTNDLNLASLAGLPTTWNYADAMSFARQDSRIDVFLAKPYAIIDGEFGRDASTEMIAGVVTANRAFTFWNLTGHQLDTGLRLMFEVRLWDDGAAELTYIESWATSVDYGRTIWPVELVDVVDAWQQVAGAIGAEPAEIASIRINNARNFDFYGGSLQYITANAPQVGMPEDIMKIEFRSGAGLDQRVGEISLVSGKMTTMALL